MRKAYAKAYLFAKGGVPIPRPEDLLFVVHSVYDWQLLDELGVSSFWVGEYEVCRAACAHLLQRIAEGLAVPAADVDRIRENLRCANAKLRP
jgi:hypothetical protein